MDFFLLPAALMYALLLLWTALLVSGTARVQLLGGLLSLLLGAGVTLFGVGESFLRGRPVYLLPLWVTVLFVAWLAVLDVPERDLHWWLKSASRGTVLSDVRLDGPSGHWAFPGVLRTD